MKIAVIDKCPSNVNYEKHFEFEFDLYHLSSVYLQKVLKKDVDIEVDLDEYDYVITVGAEATKHFTKESVTNSAGLLIQEKFIPITNPAMLTFKPEGKHDFERALKQLNGYLDGSIKNAVVSGDFRGIEDEEEAFNFLQEVLNSEAETIALDTENT